MAARAAAPARRGGLQQQWQLQPRQQAGGHRQQAMLRRQSLQWRRPALALRPRGEGGGAQQDVHAEGLTAAHLRRQLAQRPPSHSWRQLFAYGARDEGAQQENAAKIHRCEPGRARVYRKTCSRMAVHISKQGCMQRLLPSPRASASRAATHRSRASSVERVEAEQTRVRERGSGARRMRMVTATRSQDAGVLCSCVR